MGNVKLQGLDATAPVQAMYLPLAQLPVSNAMLAVRANSAPWNS